MKNMNDILKLDLIFMAKVHPNYNNPNTCACIMLAAVLPPVCVIQYTVPELVK